MQQKMSYAGWAELLAQSRGKPDYQRWMGVSPGGAAVQLKVSRQRVWQLVKDGRLDMVMLADNEAAEPSAWLVTNASVERYRKSKPMAQEPLPLARPARIKARR
jgi:hypothetical protein